MTLTLPKTPDELGRLHNDLADVLSEAINERELHILTLPDGEKKAVLRRNAAILNVARQFLKDNGIEAVAAPGSKMEALKQSIGKLPFPGEEFNEVAGVH